MASDILLSSENTAPSSPSSKATFSDDPTRASTPPSSPPCFPWELQRSIDNDTKSTSVRENNAFSLLGKRKFLEPISENERPAKKRAASAPQPASTESHNKPLTQMRISLGQEVQKKCQTCGMEYVPSLPEDRALHAKYHKQNTEGYDLGKDFVQRGRAGSVHDGGVSGDWICAVDCNDRPARTKRAQDVLEIVQRELGAVEIPEKDVWMKMESVGWKYRAYLYVRDAKCIGFLLVQRIQQAHMVEQPVLQPKETERRSNGGMEVGTQRLTALAALKARKEAAAESDAQLAKEPLVLSKRTRPASLGISRIWTSAPYRHQAIATKLLDIAIEHHNYPVLSQGDGRKRGLEARLDERGKKRELEGPDAKRPGDRNDRNLQKEDVAFSQPTEAGTRLARKWFGKLWGWSVYVE